MAVFAATWNEQTQRWEYNAEATALAALAGWESLDDVPAEAIPDDTAYGDDTDDDDDDEHSGRGSSAMTGTCPICGQPVENLVRIGAYLFTEPCAHRILDLQQFAWYRRYRRNRRIRDDEPNNVRSTASSA